jgi:parallel beta-helix repeat protein
MFLGSNIAVQTGASVQISAPTTRWLRLLSAAGRIISITAFGGDLDIGNTCITTWDPAQNRTDTEHADGRAYVLARNGAQMNIDNAEIRYLGSGDVESYGVSWRLDNELHDNVVYGADPHTGSHGLTIERNVVHDNGKHGIILAEDCTNSVIRDNIVYRNNHHGIVLNMRSDRNVIEDNDTFANTAQGININESNNNVIRGNRVYDNTESGIGITQTSQDNLVENNQSRGNQQDGIRVVSEASGSVIRSNMFAENRRHGIYVDVRGKVDIEGNTIFKNRSGIMLKSSIAVPDGDNTFFDNQEADITND